MKRRLEGRDGPSLAWAFHEAIARGIALMTCRLCDAHAVDSIVFSGGTFQNALLMEMVRRQLPPSLQLWTNQQVPPNDGGISLGQAALAGLAQP
jgi:hydrogenase maturation protein HypF